MKDSGGNYAATAFIFLSELISEEKTEEKLKEYMKIEESKDKNMQSSHVLPKIFFEKSEEMNTKGCGLKDKIRTSIYGILILVTISVLMLKWAKILWANEALYHADFIKNEVERINFMSEDVFRWVIGIGLVSTVLGGVVSLLWYRLLALIFGVKRGWKAVLTNKGMITGIIERAFFAVAIAADLGGVTIAMILWSTLKSNTMWGSFLKKEEPDWNRVTVGLLASMGSMVIAIVAGKICDGKILMDSIEALRLYIVAL